MPRLVLFVLLGSFAFASSPAAEDAPGQGQASKSWIDITPTIADKTYVEGEPWSVTVAYDLAAADDHGGTTLALMAVGPWVDCPDGTYEKERHHVNYFGGKLRDTCPVTAGPGSHTFTFTLPKALPRNGLLLICQFADAAGKAFPWQVRAGGPWFTRASGFFELSTVKPGNCFTYQEPVVVVAKLRNVKDAGAKHTLAVKAYDARKNVIDTQQVAFTSEKDGQDVPITLKTEARGIILIEAEVEGWEKRATTICRIPDVQAVTKGKPTAFGMHNLLTLTNLAEAEQASAVAQRLGLTVCRNFISWASLEPSRGVFHFETLDKQMDIMRAHGIEPELCIQDPPVWALKGPARNVAFQAFDCDLDAWREFVTAATTHYKGRMSAWEWLNEIVPGEGKDPVGNYLALCKAGTEAARAVDPKVKFLLAGGLFPRSFRNQVLKSGTGAYVDVLPVHYSAGDGIVEARQDLDAAGCAKAAVWDDESARGVNAWNVPAIEEVANTTQSQWLMSQWVDELTAGAERIIWFGGWPDPCGGWSYLLDDMTPRPAAATLAVLVSKLHQAKPLGAFTEGKGTFELFDRGGKAVLVLLPGSDGEKPALRVGSESLVATDYQGNESPIAAKGGNAELALSSTGSFVENGDLDVLKAYVVAALQSAKGKVPRGGRRPADFRTTMMVGESSELYVSLKNPYERKIAGKLTLAGPKDWPAIAPVPFELAPGEDTVAIIPVALPKDAKVGEHAVQMQVSFAWDKLPAITKPVMISVISPDMLGNLLKNGGLEDADPKNPGAPASWSGKGEWISSVGLGVGLGDKVMKFSNCPEWSTTNQTIPLSPGGTYLYSAWLWNQGIHAGSNIGLTMTDGTNKNLYDVQVFTAGENNASWQMFTSHLTVPDTIATGSFTPVVKGAGTVYYDNLRVTAYEGTDYVAECHRASAAPKIDGKLDLQEWNRACPIPLIGANQLTLTKESTKESNKGGDPSYTWTPRNLSGVGYVMWDDANLYVAVQVRDDVAHADGADASVVDGDSVVLAFDSTNRSPDGDKKAFELFLSAQKPGGGSGLTTIFRPEAHAGGLRSGQLARDSSIYELAISKVEAKTDDKGDASAGGWIYELRIPFSDLGGFQPGLGRKLAFSMQIHDNDGKGRAATMTWGGGLQPEWKPADFGVVTFVK